MARTCRWQANVVGTHSFSSVEGVVVNPAVEWTGLQFGGGQATFKAEIDRDRGNLVSAAPAFGLKMIIHSFIHIFLVPVRPCRSHGGKCSGCPLEMTCPDVGSSMLCPRNCILICMLSFFCFLPGRLHALSGEATYARLFHPRKISRTAVPKTDNISLPPTSLQNISSLSYVS